jgi:hypothetical protein
MTQYSPRLGTPYPATTDQANISSDIGAIALSLLDSASIYHQNANATTPPSGHIGDIWWCSDIVTNPNPYFGLNYFDGVSWKNVGPDVVVSATTPTTIFSGLVWINPTGTPVIQVYNNGAWSTVLGYGVPGSATDGQFLQYSAGSSGLVWATIPQVPGGGSNGQLLYSNSGTPAWRNPPAIVTGYVATAGVTISTGGVALVPSSSMGTLTGFTQYLFSVSFDTSALVSASQQTGQPAVQAGTKPAVNGAVLVSFTASATVGGAVIQQRAFAGTFIAGIDGGGTATAVINTAISTTVYAFSVGAITTAGSMVVKNGQFTVTGIK